MHPKIATASSSRENDGWISSLAINGIQGSDFEDMFHSADDNYPWFAIDLGFLYKVFTSFFHIHVTHNLLISIYF